jgi:MoxR-like ATPase
MDLQPNMFETSISGIQVRRSSAEIFSVPAVDESYQMPEKLTLFMDQLSRLGQVNCMLTGMQSSGKTEGAQQVAARTGRKCFVMDCGTLQEPSQFFGTMKFSPTEGTYFLPSAFIEAVQQANMVLVLDEINRVESPKVLNALMPLLDERRKIWVEDIGDWIKVAANVVFFATANIGSSFHGIEYLDKALVSRFVHNIRMDWPDESLQIRIFREKCGVNRETAQNLMKLGRTIRENKNQTDLSLRQLIAFGKMLAFGLSPKDSAEITFADAWDDVDTRAGHTAVMQALQAVFVDVENPVKVYG